MNTHRRWHDNYERHVHEKNSPVQDIADSFLESSQIDPSSDTESSNQERSASSTPIDHPGGNMVAPGDPSGARNFSPQYGRAGLRPAAHRTVIELKANSISGLHVGRLPATQGVRSSRAPVDLTRKITIGGSRPSFNGVYSDVYVGRSGNDTVCLQKAI